MRFRPKLRTVLLIVNLTIIILPILFIAGLRIYETELVKQTESGLLAQGTVISLVYRDRLVAELGDAAAEYGGYRLKTPQKVLPVEGDGDGLDPVLPKLDVARENLRQPIGEARIPASESDEVAVAVGQEITPLIEEAQNATLAGIRVVDWRGNVVASTGIELGLSLVHREEVSRALRGERVSLLYMRSPPSKPRTASPLSRRTRYRVHVAIPVIYDNTVLGAVILMRTPLDVSKALYYHRRALAVGALALLLVVLVVTVLTSLTISRPISRLIGQIERISRGEGVNEPPDKPGAREFVRLSKAFSEMAGKLEKRAEYINAFVSNVSHGFKTPLASTRASVELLTDHFDDMTAQERARFLKIIETDVSRLGRLVERLTELAQADTQDTRGETTPIQDVLHDLVERYRAYGLDVELELDPRAEYAAVDRETFESIITNLLDNVRQHGGDGVKTRLITRAVKTDNADDIEIMVQDDGPGISPGNRNRVFRPFFTTAKQTGGTGLGLSIIGSLVKANGGSIRLDPSDKGSCFIVRLPEHPEF